MWNFCIVSKKFIKIKVKGRKYFQQSRTTCSSSVIFILTDTIRNIFSAEKSSVCWVECIANVKIDVNIKTIYLWRLELKVLIYIFLMYITNRIDFTMTSNCFCLYVNVYRRLYLLTFAMATAQLYPASSISWSTLKAYSVNNSSSIFWASTWLYREKYTGIDIKYTGINIIYRH